MGAVAYTHTLDGHRLVQRAGASSLKSRARVDGDVVTRALNKEETTHLYGQESGEVITRLRRVK